MTNVDINSGTIDGAIIGGSSAAAGTFTSLNVSEGAITNVGNISCDSISSDTNTSGLDVNFNGNTTLNTISLTDNLADH